RHAEHFASSLSIGTGNNRRVHVEELVFIEKLMNRETHRTSHTENRTEKIGTETEMCLLTQNFKRVFLRLKDGFISLFGEVIAQNCNFPSDDFNALASSLAFNHFTNDF